MATRGLLSGRSRYGKVKLRVKLVLSTTQPILLQRRRQLKSVRPTASSLLRVHPQQHPHQQNNHNTHHNIPRSETYPVELKRGEIPNDGGVYYVKNAQRIMLALVATTQLQAILWLITQSSPLPVGTQSWSRCPTKTTSSPGL